MRSRRPDTKRTPALLIAVGVHVVAAFVLLQALTIRSGWRIDFGFDSEPREQRVTLVEPTITPTPTTTTPPPRAAVARGTSTDAPLGAATTPPAASERLIAPRDSGLGRILSPAEAAVVGVKPGGDYRLWTMADLRTLRKDVQEGRTVDDGIFSGRGNIRAMDSIIAFALIAAKDSLDSLAVINGNGALIADWTRTDKNGNKWGVDAAGIRLGKVTIPSALLGFLPVGAQQAMSGNRTVAERNRQLAFAQQDIARFRQSGPGNDQFRMLVDELRERRDRERAERRKMMRKPVTDEQGDAPPPRRP
jgi:hypothetical protein